MLTGIDMTPRNRLAILERARKILSNPKRWTSRQLRNQVGSRSYQYCLLGACEEAAYRLRLVQRTPGAMFGEGGTVRAIGYSLADDLGINAYALRKTRKTAYEVNDDDGYEATLALLDGCIVEIKENEKDANPEGD